MATVHLWLSILTGVEKNAEETLANNISPENVERLRAIIWWPIGALRVDSAPDSQPLTLTYRTWLPGDPMPAAAYEP